MYFQGKTLHCIPLNHTNIKDRDVSLNNYLHVIKVYNIILDM